MFSGAKTKMFDRVLQDTVRLRTIKFSQRDLIWLNITSLDTCTKSDDKNLFENFFAMLCAIWYCLSNLENVKNTHGGVFL